ncbi:MAG: hypothetical protein JHC41_00870, partial [Nitrosopumilus sp.]|nr:hypothetical protein [Nitrosopumilus sp.]
DCPQSNGLNERLNQTLVNRIRCKINSGTKQAWSTIARECVKEYNQTIHSSTKFEPEYLLYGTKSTITPDELPKSDLTEDRIQAGKNSMRNFELNKKRVDKNRQAYEFKVGDQVYVQNGSKLNRGKMEKIRVGPFKILRKISSSIYEVDCGKKKKESNFFHINKLSLFIPQKKVT